MKAGARLVVLVCGLAALLTLSASAAAKPGYYVSKPSRFIVLSLSGSHGYSLFDVYGYGSRVGILAIKGGFVTSTSATYSVRGKVTGDGVEARFGSRGRVAVRLQPGARVEVGESRPECKGRPQVTRWGRFTGTIRFQGERGFTQVRATAARGFVTHNHRLVCKRNSGQGDQPLPKAPPATSLSAVSSHPRAPWFSVLKEEPPRARHQLFAEYTAAVTEKREGMTISRTASTNAPPETFVISPTGSAPITATVSPGGPFSGTATYEKDVDGSVSWSGDLAVELPGRGVVPLADPTYKVELCRSFACACPVGPCGFITVSSSSSSGSTVQRLRQLAERMRP